MNLFVYWTNANGEEELITAPLDGTILPGVTRSCVIELAKEWGISVKEGYIGIEDLLKGLKEGRVKECFGAGTACVISPVEGVQYKGTVCHVEHLHSALTRLPHRTTPFP